jgi:transcriptional regulator with XRE-family HTH domain
MTIADEALAHKPQRSDGMTPQQAFGKQVRMLRKRRGIKQTVLAAALGYSPTSANSMISKLERGKVNLTLEKIFVLAEALQVSPAELFVEEEATSVRADVQVLSEVSARLDEQARTMWVHYGRSLIAADDATRQDLQGHLRLVEQVAELRHLKRVDLPKADGGLAS